MRTQIAAQRDRVGLKSNVYASHGRLQAKRIHQRLKLSVERRLGFGVGIWSAYGAEITHPASLSCKATTPRPRASAGQKPDISLMRFTVINRDPQRDFVCPIPVLWPRR
jgi:hypothetical protein